jgi:hypothetical protein
MISRLKLNCVVPPSLGAVNLKFDYYFLINVRHNIRLYSPHSIKLRNILGRPPKV